MAGDGGKKRGGIAYDTWPISYQSMKISFKISKQNPRNNVVACQYFERFKIKLYYNMKHRKLIKKHKIL